MPLAVMSIVQQELIGGIGGNPQPEARHDLAARVLARPCQRPSSGSFCRCEPGRDLIDLDGREVADSQRLFED